MGEFGGASVQRLRGRIAGSAWRGRDARAVLPLAGDRATTTPEVFSHRSYPRQARSQVAREHGAVSRMRQRQPREILLRNHWENRVATATAKRFHDPLNHSVVARRPTRLLSSWRAAREPPNLAPRLPASLLIPAPFARQPDTPGMASKLKAGPSTRKVARCFSAERCEEPPTSSSNSPASTTRLP
jgi:hypothetical protein